MRPWLASAVLLAGAAERARDQRPIQSTARTSDVPATAATMSRSEIVAASSLEEPQKAEQETADEGSDQTHAEVLQGAEAPALPRDDEPGEASADQAHDDPDDDLRKGRHHGSLLGMSSHSAGAGVTPVIWARGSSLSQRVTVYDYPDGRFAIKHKGLELPYRPFDRRQQVDQAAVVENKRLGPVLAYIAERQKELDISRRTSPRGGAAKARVCSR